MAELNGDNGDIGWRLERRRLFLTAVILIVIQVIVAGVAYMLVPEQMPMHWNALGQVDSYASKLMVLCFSPVLSLCVLVLVDGIVAFGRYTGRENRRIAIQFSGYVVVALIVLMQVIQLISIAISLHVPIDAQSVIFVVVALFFIGMGNYMGKLRRNPYVGIKTPWTVADDTVWERTHRLGGWLFVAAGMIGLITAFVPVPGVSLVGLLAPILLVSVITVAYSYWEYQKVARRGGENG